MMPRLSFSGSDVHVHLNIADIGDAGQLVELHVGVQHAAGLRIHDALFDQRRADAHDACAEAPGSRPVFGLTTSPQSCTATSLLSFTRPVSISTETSAIWTPRRAAGIQAFRLLRIVLAHLDDGVHAELLAGLLPAHALVGVADDADAAVHRLQLIGRNVRAMERRLRTTCVSALTVALRADEQTPPTVVEPPDGPEAG